LRALSDACFRLQVFWSGAILSSLASTASVLMGGSRALCVGGSVLVALSYTLFGGLRVVALTDVVQLLIFCGGLLLLLPFCWHHPSVDRLHTADALRDALGSWERSVARVPMPGALEGGATVDLRGEWLDRAFLCLFGHVGQQVFAQRVLSACSPAAARQMGLLAGGCHYAVAVLCAALAFVATRADWAAMGGEAARVCVSPSAYAPCALRFIPPKALGWVGLAAVGAAMMSSIDSAVLAAASLVSAQPGRRGENAAKTAVL
jgi:high affinity choline transporter 7